MTDAKIEELMAQIVDSSAVLMETIQTSGYQDKGNGWSVTLPGPGISITLKMEDFTKLQVALIKMTQQKFISLCEKYTIEPTVALENDALIKALDASDDAEVERILNMMWLSRPM